ncbi:unnamed protein product [Adineta ricciae]|uniref:Transposase n=1 Tax=Adineta ricciae TaxID=249248 RepID=A0A815TYB6_ADIRI|nr:unnamed protein product [Adineta ricciae]CAF1512229.1 unnamed protein product [Adineta ricciae]
MGPGFLSIGMAQHWSDRFRNGNYELDDQPKCGRPIEVDIDLFKQQIEQDPRLTTRALAALLGFSHITVEKHLADLGKSWTYGVWIPHELSTYQLQSRVDTCMDLITFHRNHQWLRNLVTGDEKVATPRMDTHPKKAISARPAIGPLHWGSYIVTADLYCAQLGRIVQKLKGKQARIYFLHDNARPHVAKLTREKLLQLGMQQSRFDSIPILESNGIGWNWNRNRMESVGIGIGIEWNWLGLELESNGIDPELAGIDPR